MVYRKPGTPIPEDCDFWWSMWHDKRYHSFVDSFVDKPLTSATYAEAGKTEGPRVRTRPHPKCDSIPDNSATHAQLLDTACAACGTKSTTIPLWTPSWRSRLLQPNMPMPRATGYVPNLGRKFIQGS